MKSSIKKILKPLRYIYIINFIRRFLIGTSYTVQVFTKVLYWLFNSREDTNYTYDLSEMNIKQLAKTIELVTGEQYLKIIEYINEPSKDKELQNEILNSINNSSEKSVTDKTTKFAKRLGWYAIVRIKKPKVVVETGVDKGLGSILLSSAIRKNTDEGYSGRYYGTDINPRAGFMLSGIYKKYGEILYGDSIQSLTKFNDKIDIFINDSDHSEEYEYDEYITVKNKLNDDAIILGDNSHCTDKLLEFSNYTNRKFIFWCEKPVDHWYAGGGIGFSFNNFSK